MGKILEFGFMELLTESIEAFLKHTSYNICFRIHKLISLRFFLTTTKKLYHEKIELHQHVHRVFICEREKKDRNTHSKTKQNQHKTKQKQTYGTAFIILLTEAIN